MKLRILVVAAIVAGVTLVPTAAWAKGAKAVTITGPGLRTPVHMENTAGPEIVEVNALARATGLYHAAFAAAPNPMTGTRPVGRLGPRYRAVYELYASVDETVTVRQDLYPFAKVGFVSHTTSGQRVPGGRTRGGWYVAADSLDGSDGTSATAILVELGAPRPRTASTKHSGT